MMPDHLPRVHPFLSASLLTVCCDDEIDAFITTGQACYCDDPGDMHEIDLALEDDHNCFVFQDGGIEVRLASLP